MIEFGAAAKREFLLESGVAFLNHGSFGAAPRVVLEAAEQWRRRMEENPDRFLREILPGRLRDAAAELARWIRARRDDVVFVDNATTGVNAVPRARIPCARRDPRHDAHLWRSAAGDPLCLRSNRRKAG